MFKTIVVGLICTIVTILAFTFIDNSSSAIALTNENVTTEIEGSEDDVSVEISGEINHPGTYSIASTETLGSLITMAGGVTEDADPKSYNESVYIGTYTSFYIAPVSQPASTCVEEEIEKVNINEAAEDELKDAGFNTTQAANTVTYREENGDFQVLEDIMNVKGIGEATFEKLKDKICLS